MRTTIAAIAVAAAAFAGTAAMAENAVTDSRAKLAKTWGAGNPPAVATKSARPTATSATSSMGRSGLGGGVWSDNYRAGRAHPPAGR